MDKNNKKINGCLAILAGLMISSSLQASAPLWTYSSPSPASVTIANGQTASVQYTVTNQSIKEKNLLLKATPGLSASPCYLAGEGSTCTLILTINGSQIPEPGLYTGPVLCETGNPNQCYQPEAGNLLQITHSSSPPVDNPGHLQLSLNGNSVTSLLFRSGDSGSLILSNTGLGNLTALTIGLPFGWQSYFTNNCPTELLPQQSCALTYAIPTPAANGILNPLTVQATHADNSLNIPVNIQALGAAKCWGLNDFGQLGSTTNSGNSNPNNVPLAVQTLSSGVTTLTRGELHTCALLDTGAVQCWGENNFGQLGSLINSGLNTPNNSPLAVQTLGSGVIAITAGNSHTCALLDTGTVKCWGLNQYGQLGSITNNGTTTPNNSPLDVQALGSGVTAITAGANHTCAQLNTGAVKCWGLNNLGQLGSITNSGTSLPNNSPLEVQTLSSGVIAITGGDTHTCALLNTGAMKCWGSNGFGQLGSMTNSGSPNPNNSPLDVQTLSSGVIAITAGAGGGEHTCALLDTGAAKCWGLNAFGELGSTANSGTLNSNNSPLNVQTLGSGVIAITAGAIHTCALLDTGAIKCWGSNRYGQLGSITNSGSAAPNNSPLDVQTLAAGSTAALLNHNAGESSCAIVY